MRLLIGIFAIAMTIAGSFYAYTTLTLKELNAAQAPAVETAQNAF